MKKNIEINKSIYTIIFVILGIFTLLPFLWMISASLKSSTDVFKFPINWIPENLYLSNYKDVWSSKTYPFYLFYTNSLKVAFFSVAGLLFIAISAAYAFARLKFKGRNIIFMIYLSALMIPSQVTLIPRFALFRWFNIYNTHYSLILPATLNIIGIFMLRQFFISIPFELSQSAKIDGASHFRICTQIILPLSKPAVLSLVILGFVWSWNDYLNPLIFLTDKIKYTIPLGLDAFIEEEQIQYNLVMTGSTCAILPLLIVFLVCQKYFISGIATSGIKG